MGDPFSALQPICLKMDTTSEPYRIFVRALGPAYDNDLYACHQQKQARCRKPPGLNVFQDNASLE